MIEGSIWFMFPIYNLWIVVFTLFVSIVFISIFQKDRSRRVSVIKKISEFALFFGSFAFLLGILASILGYFQAIDAIEQAGDMSTHVMGSGFKVATLPALYGLALLILAFVVWYTAKVLRKQM